MEQQHTTEQDALNMSFATSTESESSSVISEMPRFATTCDACVGTRVRDNEWKPKRPNTNRQRQETQTFINQNFRIAQRRLLEVRGHYIVPTPELRAKLDIQSFKGLPPSAWVKMIGLGFTKAQINKIFAHNKRDVHGEVRLSSDWSNCL